MTDYRLWPSTNGSGTVNGGFTHDLGTQFKVNEDGVTFNGFYFWAPSGTFDTDHTKYSFRLYSTTNGTTGTLISGTTVNLAADLTQNAWNYQALTTPVDLTNGTTYVAVVHYSGSSNSYVSSANYWSSGDGVSGITAGPITAPGTSTALNAAQCAYNEPSASASFPTSTLGSNYWIDVSVSYTAAGGGGGGSEGITHVDSESDSGTSNTSSTTVTKPSGLQVGDVMIAFVVMNDDTAATGPSGWTKYDDDVSSGTTHFRSQVWYCVATSTQVAASSFTWTDPDGPNSPMWAAISAYRGVDTTTPILTAANSSFTTSTNPVTGPSITTTADSRVVHFRCVRISGSQVIPTYTGSGTRRFQAGNHGSSTSYSGASFDADVDTAAGTISGISITSSSTPTTALSRTIALKVYHSPNANPTAGVAAVTVLGKTPTLDLDGTASPGAANVTAGPQQAVAGVGGVTSVPTNATVSVPQVDVFTTPFKNAPAGVAQSTVSVKPTRMQYAPAGTATATVLTNNASESIGNRADTAQVQAAAYKPSLGFGVSAGVAHAGGSGQSISPALEMAVGDAEALAAAYFCILYFGSTRTIKIGEEIRTIVVPWEDRILMVEES